MEGTYDALRRQAENDLSAIRQHRDSGKRISVKQAERLARIQKDLTSAIRDYDEMEDRRPYSDTNIGYNSNMKQRGYSADSMVRSAMDMVNKILPRVDDDFEGDAEMRRGRPRTTRRGVGRYTQVRRHTRRMPRGEMDDFYDDVADRYDDMDDDMDDDFADEMEARRRRGRSGRFIRGDMDDARYEDMRRAVDEARRTADEARRTADEARRSANEKHGIYPGTPVMPRNDRYARTDDARDDDAHRPGPDMRR